MKFTCSTAISELDRAYTETRAALAECFETLETESPRRESVRNNALLSDEGKTAELDKIAAEVAAARRRADELSAAAVAKFAEIRENALTAAGGRYKVRVQDIDRNALDLLKSGILTNEELFELAEQYKGNATMRRIIGKEMTTRAAEFGIDPNERARLNATAANLNENTLTGIIDRFVEICAAGTRPDPTRANGTHNYLYSQYHERARNEADALDAEFSSDEAAPPVRSSNVVTSADV